MLRLPKFTYHRPTRVADAVALKAQHGKQASFVAGGTDLYPNMKRRQQRPAHVIGLSAIGDLYRVDGDPVRGLDIGAMVTLRDLEQSQVVREHYAAVAQAVRLVSTPLLRNMGTIGGNLLLDTRCNYYDQTHEWREAIDFCMKCDGSICWVAPSSPRCWAVQSSDTVPLLVALGAEATLVGARGARRIALGDLYRDDGIAYLNKEPDELLTQVHLPPADGWRASYQKLRRRGTFDFPVLGVGVWLRLAGDVVQDVRIRIGGAGSHPIAALDAERALVGQKLTHELLEAAAQTAYKPTRAMDNTDHEALWRKKMAPIFVARAVREAVQLAAV
ncbi:MAG: xanthine dehydrogenase family protein subunit M [Planctomycetota bacterium]